MSLMPDWISILRFRYLTGVHSAFFVSLAGAAGAGAAGAGGAEITVDGKELSFLESDFLEPGIVQVFFFLTEFLKFFRRLLKNYFLPKKKEHIST